MLINPGVNKPSKNCMHQKSNMIFHNKEDTQILSATTQNLVTWVTDTWDL